MEGREVVWIGRAFVSSSSNRDDTSEGGSVLEQAQKISDEA